MVTSAAVNYHCKHGDIESMSLRIVQLTDLHLFQNPEGRLAGVPTWSTFRAVLEQVRSRHADFD